MKFKKWLYSDTAERLAGIMGVKLRTIYKWRAGDTQPNRDHMQKLVEISKGKLTYKDIIEFQP